MPNQQNSDILSKERLAKEVYDAIGFCATHLRNDYAEAISSILHAEKASDDERAQSVMESILENASIAERDHVPICQDTGYVWVCLEVGPDQLIPGDIFSLVNDAVARAYKDNFLRKSLVKDALFDRSNTMDNTPAFCEVKFTEENGCKLHVLLKGGGSDNASRVVMLPPGSGETGIIDAVCDCVLEKAANACPPLVIGLGVGSTFDKVAGLAKHALLRPVDAQAKDPKISEFETQVLDAVNALDIGPGALGGYPTCLAVHLETAPCHIAALPLAINMGCCAMRSVTLDL